MAGKEVEKGKWDKVLALLDETKLITICRNLVKIPGYLGQEEAVSDYVAGEMRNIGVALMETPISGEDSPRRRSVHGILRGDGTGKSLFCTAHMDTFHPREGQLYPHDGMVEDGKIYGVGMGDNLDDVAAFIVALDTIKRSGVKLRGDITAGGTVDELGAKRGAKAILDSGFKADMCIFGDTATTPLHATRCNVGKVEAEVRTSGASDFPLAAVSERFHIKSVNAVASMIKLIGYLYKMAEEEPYFHKPHPMLPGEGAAFYIGPIIGGSVGPGDPTRKAGMYPGGAGLASPVPTWCRLRVGCRYWPGETAQEFIELLNKWVEKAKADDSSIQAEVECYLDHGNVPFETTPDTEVVDVLRRAVRYVHGEELKFEGHCGTGEQQFYSQAPMDCIEYGCNMRIGRKDEHVTVKELIDLCKVYIVAMLEACA